MRRKRWDQQWTTVLVVKILDRVCHHVGDFGTKWWDRARYFRLVVRCTRMIATFAEFLLLAGLIGTVGNEIQVTVTRLNFLHVR
jgi:hypothetical protein